LILEGLCVECGDAVSDKSSKRVNLDWIGRAFGFTGPLHASKEFAVEMYRVDNRNLQQNGKLRLVLDLDETLIHSTRIKNNVFDDEDLMDFESFEDGCFLPSYSSTFHNKKEDYTVYKEDGSIHFSIEGKEFKLTFRPHVFQFLHEVQKYFDVYIYSNGTRNYVYRILNIIRDQLHLMNLELNISGVLGRDPRKRRSPKMLHKMLCSRSRTIVIDDQPRAWHTADAENILRITPFIDNHEDNELFYLDKILKEIHKKFFTVSNRKVDVRTILGQIRNKYQSL
jgi:TFIIF-interacting CTD phosphatase-like protein